MIVQKSTRKRNSIISYNRDYKFRDEVIVFPKKRGNTIYLTTFNNIYLKYEVLTVPLSNGNYKIRITTLDNLENESSFIQGDVSVNFYILPPTELEGSVSGNQVTLTWQHSINGAPTNYRIYGNNGSGETIDRTSPIATISGNLLTHIFTVADGAWKFIVEAIESSEESVNLYPVYLTVPVTNTVPNTPGVSNESVYSATGINLTNVSVGKVKIDFLWLYSTNAASFNVYHNDGSGDIDFTTPKYNFARQDSDVQTYTTPQLHTDDVDKTYKFAVRAVTSSGVTDKNTDVYEITVDGVAPDDPIDLDLSTAF